MATKSTKTAPDYYRTEWVEVGKRGRWKGVPRLGQYETKALTETHARIRANYPARTFPVTIIRDAGLPMAVHGDNIAITDGWDAARKAVTEHNAAERRRKDEAVRRQRAEAAGEILHARIAAAPEGAKLETLIAGLLEYRNTGKIEG